MSDWASSYVLQLQNGIPKIKFRPKGHSMVPLIYSGDEVTIKSFLSPEMLEQKLGYDELLEKGDIAFCRVNGKHYVHKVLAVEKERVLIGNNKGHTNGWTRVVYGKVINVAP